jgi:uncharacterized protein (DUF111 family)
MSSAKRIFVIDCQTAGISGDKLVGALFDLLPEMTRSVAAMKSAGEHHHGCRKIDVKVQDVMRGGFLAKKVDVEADEDTIPKTGAELSDIVQKCADDLCLSVEARQFALGTAATLIETEAKLHGKSIGKVRLHEAGSVDTTAEVIGAATALEDLGILKDTTIISTPVAVGGGLLNFSHGVVSSPAPATLEILRRKSIPIVGGPVDTELTSPTGASFLVNLVQKVSRFYPPMKVIGVGYGAGIQDPHGVPNVLRVVTGASIDDSS